MDTREKAKQLFQKSFGDIESTYVYSHGRLEIIGNHTDHNHGLCLVGGCQMGIHGYVAKQAEKVEISSDGYAPFSFSSLDLERKMEEEGKTIALTRGVLSRLNELGYKVGGFKAAFASDIFPGAGVSSSACYESLIVAIISHLYNDGKIDPDTMSKVGQYAEKFYFGKPCGLLDQTGTSYGGIDYLDFKDPNAPIVQPMKFNLPLDIVLVNTGSHAKLTGSYASIPHDMYLVASYYDRMYLRDVGFKHFSVTIDKRRNIPEGPKNRAKHFYAENGRVNIARQALLHANVDSFLAQIKASQESSKNLLKNTMVKGVYEGSPQEAVDIANQYIKHGACRIMGGGFAGSIICFVDPSETASFIENMSKHYPPSAIVLEKIVDGGPQFGGQQ